MSLWVAAVLGLVEGLTEYLPVSSTGHLVIAGHLLGEQGEASKSFEIVIQLGAILAVLIHYRRLLAERARGLATRNPDSVRLLLALLAGFVPTAIVGLAVHKKIKELLFGDRPIAIAFIVGGVVMLAVEGYRASQKLHGEDGLDKVTPLRGFLIGLGQCFSLIPGTSRSMSTIVTGQLLGLSTATSAEFSFLLGLPTLGAATVYEGLKQRHELLADGPGPLLVGMVVSFLVAWAVVAGFLRYLQRRGLAPFGVYRLIAGALVLHFLVR